MKNKILSFLLVMCLVFPAALFLTACKGKDDEGDSAPPEPTALEIFNTANTNLGTILDNATVSMVPTAQITAGVMKIYGGEDYTIVYKKDDGKTNIAIPETMAEYDTNLIIDGNGNYYAKWEDEEWSVNATEGKTSYKYIEDLTELDDLIKGVSDAAHFYQSTPLKLKTEESTRYLSLDLDIGTRLNNALIINYKNNHDEPISYFINTLLSDLSQKDINIVELVDDFTISMTDETTMLEFVEYFAEELGLSTDKVVGILNKVIDHANQVNGSGLDTSRISSDGFDTDVLYVGHYEYVAPLDLDTLDEFAILPLIRESFEDNSLTGADLSQMFERMVEDEDYAYTLDDIIAQSNAPEVEEFVFYLENATINMLGLNVKITLDSNNKPTKILFTLTGDGIIKEDDSTYLPMDINATLDCSFSNIGSTTVSLPRTATDELDYYFDIALDQETFYWDDTVRNYTFKADSSLLPDSFTIIVDGETIATFNEFTRNLQIDLIKIRELIEEYYEDITYYEPNVYEMSDADSNYYISVRVA